MRVVLTVAIVGLMYLSVAYADAPAKTRVMGEVVVTDGSVVNWPDCMEGETPEVEYHRGVGHFHIGKVEVMSSFGSWTFHIQAFDDNGRALTGDALKQAQVPATLYCKPSGQSSDDHG